MRAGRRPKPASLKARGSSRARIQIGQIARAFQVIVHLKRIELAGKTQRLVTGIAEITGRMEGNIPEVAPVFEDKGDGLRWTGIHPRCLETMRERSGLLRDMRSIVSM